MLQITIPGPESWDERNEEFVAGPDTIISLEHSLISISKWESKWHKPFLGKQQPNGDELLDYIKCMTITSNIKDDVYERLTKKNIDDILNYINDPMTATTITERDNRRRSSEIITSELIYYWMVAMQIPFECQKWHINRLLMLIRICGNKNQPDKKMSKRSTMQQNAALNAARRKKLHSRG
jgi:hypothetical protein